MWGRKVHVGEWGVMVGLPFILNVLILLLSVWKNHLHRRNERVGNGFEAGQKI